jgi:hypothetical protein
MRKITVILSLMVLLFVSVAYASDRDMDNFAKVDSMFLDDIASVALHCDLHYKKIVNTSAPALPESYVTTRTVRVYTHAEFVNAHAKFRAHRQAGTALYAVCPLKPEIQEKASGMEIMEVFIGFQKAKGGEER